MLERILVYRPNSGISEKEVDETYRAFLGQSSITAAENILIKAGSDVLLNGDGSLDRETIAHLAEQMVKLMRGGKRISYITSGARRTGIDYLGDYSNEMSPRGLCIAGQPSLMQVYSEIFGNYRDIKIGQILLEDQHFHPNRREEVRAGFDDFYRGCDKKGIVIANANDATWPGETEQDNDNLAAKTCRLLNADFVICLSGVPGLLEHYGTEQERLINWVYDVNTNLYELASSERMVRKLKAMREVIRQGKHAVIADGKQPNVILDVLAGKNVGTWFCRPKRD